MKILIQEACTEWAIGYIFSVPKSLLNNIQ